MVLAFDSQERLVKELDQTFEQVMHFAQSRYLDFLMAGLFQVGALPAPESLDGLPEDWEPVVDETAVVLLMESLVLDVPAPGGETVFQEFLRRNGAGLRTSVLRVLEQWADSRVSVYEVITAAGPSMVRVADVFSQEKFTVKYPESGEVGPVELEQGDLLFTRLVPKGAYHQYNSGCFLIPAVFREDFMDQLTSKFEAALENDPTVKDWTSFLKCCAGVVIMLVEEYTAELSPIDRLESDWLEKLDELAEQGEEAVAVAQLLVGHMDGEYPPQDVDLALDFWSDYYVDEAPRFKKPEAVAAAVEYFVARCTDKPGLTQTMIAEKYGVSPAQISSRWQDFLLYLETRRQAASGSGDSELASPAEPLPTEKMLWDSARLLRGREFGSMEELNRFLREHGNERPALDGSPSDRAQELCYIGWVRKGPERVRLAREALALDPHCADAYLLLAEEMEDLNEALELYQEAVQAGEEHLGPEFFAENTGKFWGMVESRPYMRARHALAQCLLALGRPDEAIVHFEEMLRLNPMDNQGVRYELLTALLARGRYGEAMTVLDRYDEDSAHWLYSRYFLSYCREGQTRKTRALARRALESNPYVVDYLTGRRRLPRREPAYYRPGSRNEAAIYVYDNAEVWLKAPGAIHFLESLQ